MRLVSEVSQEKIGYFGEFGGSFVPPELQNVLDFLEKEFLKYKDDPEFNEELNYYFREYCRQRNTPLLCRTVNK